MESPLRINAPLREYFILNLHNPGAGVGFAVGLKQLMVKLKKGVAPLISVHQIASLILEAGNVESGRNRLNGREDACLSIVHRIGCNQKRQ